MDNTVCLNIQKSKGSNNYTACYQEKCDRNYGIFWQKNALCVKEVLGQIETKLTHKPGNEQYYLQFYNSYSAMTEIT